MKSKKFDKGEELKASDFDRRYSAASMAVTNRTIQMCETLVEAEQALSTVRFNELCRSQKLSKRSSTFRKFRSVGSNARRLYSHAYYLPFQLNALYECARLKEETLVALVNAGRIHRSMTDAELKKAIRSDQPLPLRKKRRKE
jgi:hypothetical protein